jgi:hypothetical protein
MMAAVRRGSEEQRRALLIALDLALFAYLLWFRAAGLSETFWLYADQIRDWQIALRRFSDLPLVGPPSLAGGNTAGPVYYWVLWAIARLLGPFFDGLPHAGGIGVAALESVGDAVLFHALARRLRSIPAALSIVLVVATAPPDAAVSATIWNPPVAIALSKIGVGLALLRGLDCLGPVLLVTAISWMAVQAHTTTLPVTLAVLAYALTPYRDGVWDLRAAARRCAAAIVMIAVLQVPWFVYRSTVDRGPSATPMGDSIMAVLRDPLGAPRPVESARALSRAVHVNNDIELPEGLVAAAIGIGVVALALRSRDGLLKAVAIGPLAASVAVYAVWQGPLTENYWYLAVSWPAALCAIGWLATVDRPVRTVAAVVCVAFVLWLQPARARLDRRPLRTSIYGALVNGARATIASGYAVRDVRTSFSMPENTDPAYIYSLLGGRLDHTAPTRVIVNASGMVSFETVE